MICPICNTANRDDARFCKGCGKRLTQTVVEAPAVTPVAAAETSEAAVDACSASAGPAARPGPAASVGVDEDISLAPTQILTPQQMVAMNSQRWQREAEHAAQVGQAGNTEHAAQEPSQPAASNHMEQAAAASALTPTAQDTKGDVADMPTVIMAPPSDEEPIPIPPPPPPFSAETAEPEAGGTAEAVPAAQTSDALSTEPAAGLPAATSEAHEDSAATPEPETDSRG